MDVRCAADEAPSSVRSRRPRPLFNVRLLISPPAMLRLLEAVCLSSACGGVTSVDDYSTACPDLEVPPALTPKYKRRQVRSDDMIIAFSYFKNCV